MELPYDLEKILNHLDSITASLETCASEVQELERGMELVKRELNLRGSQKDPATQRLHSFVTSKSPELLSLTGELRVSRSEYNQCVEYFGENTKLLESSTAFFSIFAKFLKQYKQCVRDYKLSQKKKLEVLLQAKIQEHQNKSHGKDASSETKVQEKRLLKQEEIYNGTLEEILEGQYNENFITMIVATISLRFLLFRSKK